MRDLVAAPSQLAQVREWLRPGHFAHPRHAELYAVMQDMDAAGKPVDAVTVTWEAARHGVAANPGSLAGGTGPFAVASAREVHLREAYGSFAELVGACRQFCDIVNGRVHRETCAVPAERLAAERQRLHPLPQAPHTAALGQTRVVNTDQTIRFGSVRYSTPPRLVGAEVWVRADGDELVVVADLAALPPAATVAAATPAAC